MPLVMYPGKSVYRLPEGAASILGSKPNDFWGQVPWGLSKRIEDLSFKGLIPGGLQRFGPDRGEHPRAILWEADADIDSDGEGSSKAEDPDSDPDTSLHWPGKRPCNSHTFLGVVIPPQFLEKYGLRMGDSVLVVNRGVAVKAQAYDFGPHSKIGEMSIACARALGIGSNPRTGNSEDHVIYLGLTESGNGYAVDPAEQAAQFERAWNRFTGRVVE